MQYRSVYLALFGAALLLPACEGSGADVEPTEGAAASIERPERPLVEGRDSAPDGVAGTAGEPLSPAVASNGAATVQAPRPDASTTGSTPGAPPAPAATSPSTPPVGTAANDILERAERVYAGIRSMEGDFVQRVYVPLLDDNIDSRGRIYHRAPDRFLMRFTDPEGDVIVTDGHYAWMYYPSNDPGQVMRARLAEGGQQVDLQREFLSDATDRFTATRTGAERVAGRDTHVLTLRPRGPSPYSEVRLWVDTENSLVRRFQITEANESVRTLELSNLRTNVDLSDELFRFTPPPGAQVIEP